MAALVGGGAQYHSPATWREWVYAAFEPGAAQLYHDALIRRVSFAATVLVQSTILLSIVLITVESLPSMQRDGGEMGNRGTFATEVFCVCVFTVELVLRVIASPFNRAGGLCGYDPDHPPPGIVLRVLRILRLARVVRATG
eukprot:gene5350-6979_t